MVIGVRKQCQSVLKTAPVFMFDELAGLYSIDLEQGTNDVRRSTWGDKPRLLYGQRVMEVNRQWRRLQLSGGSESGGFYPKSGRVAWRSIHRRSNVRLVNDMPLHLRRRGRMVALRTRRTRHQDDMSENGNADNRHEPTHKRDSSGAHCHARVSQGLLPEHDIHSTTSR